VLNGAFVVQRSRHDGRTHLSREAGVEIVKIPPGRADGAKADLPH
jgi:hypothetical protein